MDFETAWKILKQDYSERGFVRNPYAFPIIEVDRDSWISEISDSIIGSIYSPGTLRVADVPKGSGSIRAGSYLRPRDALVYTAAIAAIIPNLQQLFRSQATVFDYAYRLKMDRNPVPWFRNRFECWDSFRRDSLKLLDSGELEYVVVTDLAAYYDNIDIQILLSDLRQIDVPSDIVALLSKCLNRWAHVTSRGIPQGASASDVIAKLYLNTVDLNLQSSGYKHLRYVDDIRIFCRSLPDAKKALVHLTRLLRARGLNLQTAKTEMLSAEDARVRFEGIVPVLRKIAKEFINEVVDFIGADLDNPYPTVADADALLAQSRDDAPMEIIRAAYEKHFVNDSDTHFDQSMFRFLINRLGNKGDNTFVDHAISLLPKQPQETQTILKYIANVGEVEGKTEQFITFMQSHDAVYPYQQYEIVEWYNNQKDYRAPSNLVQVVRNLLYDKTSPGYLHTVCRYFLARHGTPADFELFMNQYSDITNPQEQCEIICSLSRLESSRRNSFLGRCQSDGEFHRRAAILARRDFI